MKRVIALLHRHGETDMNAGNKFRSRMDPQLDPHGLKQAVEAAEFLERYDLARIITSPMLRAYQTAVITQESGFTHIHIEQNRELLPWDLGFMAGKDRDPYLPILEFFISCPDVVPPEGECLSNFKMRTEQFFAREFEEAEGLNLYVCHTSNIVSLNNILNNNEDLKPEIGESVGPGGVVAIVEGAHGLEMEPVWGIEKKAEYGVS
jgi:broad specificity phosphatase PhoE